MSDLTRVSISLDASLLQAFDRFLEAKGYTNRSEAIRDLIRDRLVRDEQSQGSGTRVAVVSLVYDHHARELAAKLLDKQHAHHDLVMSSMHVHLRERHCLEVTVLRGPLEAVRRLADELIAIRGVLHGEVMVTGDEAVFNRLQPHWTSDPTPTESSSLPSLSPSHSHD